MNAAEPARTKPSYDEWLIYCFERGHYHFAHSEIETEEVAYFVDDIEPITLAHHLHRLLRDPNERLLEYSDRQIADAIGFLFGIGSEYFRVAASEHIPIELQQEVFGSIGTYYTRFLDRVCNRRGSTPDRLLIDTDQIDIATYMIYDTVFGDYAGEEHLSSVTIESLSEALLVCRTSSCKVSILNCLHILDAVRRPGVGREAVRELLGRPDEPSHVLRLASARGIIGLT